MQVVAAVAEQEGVDPTGLEHPLDDVVDTDALDALFQPKSSGEPRGNGSVSFEYHGYEVFVSSDGRVSVDPLEEEVR